MTTRETRAASAQWARPGDDGRPPRRRAPLGQREGRGRGRPGPPARRARGRGEPGRPDRHGDLRPGADVGGPAPAVGAGVRVPLRRPIAAHPRLRPDGGALGAAGRGGARGPARRGGARGPRRGAGGRAARASRGHGPRGPRRHVDGRDGARHAAAVPGGGDPLDPHPSLVAHRPAGAGVRHTGAPGPHRRVVAAPALVPRRLLLLVDLL